MDLTQRGLPRSLHIMLNLWMGDSCLDCGVKDSETESRLERKEYCNGLVMSATDMR